MNDWKLVTLEITYALPDYPGLVQELIFQHLDLPPSYPSLQRFLAHWRKEIQQPIRSIRMAHRDIFEDVDISHLAGEFRIQ